ncbi:MAG TPA: hypothetical protein VN577_14780, partial [Terriglobales bacterium]|nr:hypothetical protein [Terriglobales bacterium]
MGHTSFYEGARERKLRAHAAELRLFAAGFLQSASAGWKQMEMAQKEAAMSTTKVRAGEERRFSGKPSRNSRS